MVTVVAVATVWVATVKVALFVPAGIVTVPGTVAAELLLDSLADMSLHGARFTVTVPVTEWPPPTLLELRVTLVTWVAARAAVGRAPRARASAAVRAVARRAPCPMLLNCNM